MSTRFTKRHAVRNEGEEYGDGENEEKKPFRSLCHVTAHTDNKDVFTRKSYTFKKSYNHAPRDELRRRTGTTLSASFQPAPASEISHSSTLKFGHRTSTPPAVAGNTTFNAYRAATFPRRSWPLPSTSDISRRHENNLPGDFKRQGSRGSFAGGGEVAHTSPPPSLYSPPRGIFASKGEVANTSPPPLLYSPPRYLAPIPRPSSAGFASGVSIVGVNIDTRIGTGVGRSSAFSLSPDIVYNMTAGARGNGVRAGAGATEILGGTRPVWPLAGTAAGDRWSYDERHGGAQGSQNDSGHVPGTLTRNGFGSGVGNDSARGSGAGISQQYHLNGADTPKRVTGQGEGRSNAMNETRTGVGVGVGEVGLWPCLTTIHARLLCPGASLSDRS